MSRCPTVDDGRARELQIIGELSGTHGGIFKANVVSVDEDEAALPFALADRSLNCLKNSPFVLGEQALRVKCFDWLIFNVQIEGVSILPEFVRMRNCDAANSVTQLRGIRKNVQERDQPIVFGRCLLLPICGVENLYRFIVFSTFDLLFGLRHSAWIRRAEAKWIRRDDAELPDFFAAFLAGAL